MPLRVKQRLQALLSEIEQLGPVRVSWRNFSRLGKDIFHCHLTYRYVVVWRLEDKKKRIIGVIYVGSREKAPY